MALPNELITVPITVNTEGGNDNREPYFGVCLPIGWTIPGDSVQCSGVYSEVIYYNDTIAIAQNSESPAPAGYYWWAGKGVAVPIDSGLVFAELQIQTDDQLGKFSIDYMLGYTYCPCGGGGGVNLERSDNHQIDIVDEYTPGVLQATVVGESIQLNWMEPFNTNGLLGYNVYRDQQLINPILLTQTSFLDELPLAGLHYYTVSSLYNNGNEYFIPYEVQVRSVLSDSLFVSPGGDDSNGGTSFNDPLRTINCAISILESDSLNPKIIFIDEGVYSPSTNGEVFPIEWKNYVSLKGIAKESSILDGDSLDTIVQFNSITEAKFEDITIRNSDGIHCNSSNPEFINMRIRNNTNRGIYCDNSFPILEDVTIFGNNGNGLECNNYSSPTLIDVTIYCNTGYGIYCNNNSSPIIESVTITNNNSGGIYCKQNSSPNMNNVSILDNQGRGIYCLDNSNPTLEDIVINNNIGGLRCEENSNPTIQNVSIENNVASSPGGGIYCDNSSPILNNVIIENNSANFRGGGIYCTSNSSPELNNVTITNNSVSVMGGGICCYENSNMQLVNVQIIGNNSSINGGGIYCFDSDLTLQNVKISDNTGYHGGGIYCYESVPSLQNVEITNNNSNSNGGGIFCNKSIPLLLNVTFSGNSAASNGSAIYCLGGSNPILKNCILWNDNQEEIYFSQFSMSNSIRIDYSDIEGGETGIITNDNGTVFWLEGNVDDDPLFVGSGELPFMLSSRSPVIDAGDPNPIYNDPEDPTNSGYALWPAMGTIRNDMGAYGGPNAASWNILTGIEDDENEELNIPVEYELTQNYPNPFNPSTTINYSLKERSQVELILYDILGRQVEVLVKEEQNAGYYNINFNAGKLASGVYIYRIKAGDFVETKKMVLMK